MVGSVFIAVMTAFVLFAEPVAAKTYTGAAGFGDTIVAPCDADVYAWVTAAGLDITSRDKVRIYYNITWEDNRAFPSSATVHRFNMTITYLGSDIYMERIVITFGATSGAEDHYRDVGNLVEYTYIHINWTAEISSINPPGYDYDRVYGNVYLR